MEKNLKETENKVDNAVKSNENLEKENKRLNERMLTVLEDLKKAEAKAAMLQNSLQVVINETKSDAGAKSDDVDKDIGKAEKEKDDINKEREEIQKKIDDLEKGLKEESAPAAADTKDRYERS